MVVIDNYPDGQVEHMEVQNNPVDPGAGTRHVPFSGELYIEREDFMESPPPKFFRLSPGKEVRLRSAYYITCTDVVKDSSGVITEVHCTYDPATRGGWSQDGRKVKGTLHWVSAPHALDAEVRLYARLFSTADPEDVPEGQDYLVNLNPSSLEVLTGCKLEPSLAKLKAGSAGVAGSSMSGECAIRGAPSATTSALAQCPPPFSAPMPVSERTCCAGNPARSTAARALRSRIDTSQIVRNAAGIEKMAAESYGNQAEPAG